jgi:hypothetical protein
VALDSSPLVKTWTKKHGLRLPYRLRGKKRKYIPDLVVEYHDGRTFLEEVKGFIYNPAKFVMKNGIAKAYCKLRGWEYRIVFEEGLERVD